MTRDCRHPVTRVLLLEDTMAVPASIVSAGLCALSPSNRARHQSLKSPVRRRQLVLARYLLAETVYRQLGIPITVERLASGQPWIPGHPFFCSISHSGEYIAVAFSTEGPVGIDVEQHRQRNFQRLVANSFHPDEIRSFNALRHDQQSSWFYRHWTAKEALAKTTGEGLGLAELGNTIQTSHAGMALSYRLDSAYSLTCAHPGRYPASLVRVTFADDTATPVFADLNWTSWHREALNGISPTAPAAVMKTKQAG